MIKLLHIFPFLVSTICFSYQQLDEKFCISYGNPSAKVKIREYFSFGCPQCIRLFNRDFSSIKKEYMDTGKVHWTFQPHPLDLTTVQAMDCLEKLSEKNKKIFLEVIFSEAQGVSAEELVLLMKKGLEVLGTPLPHLEKMSYLRETPAFHAAFACISQENTIEEVPSIEINGVLHAELPDKKLIDKKVKELSGEKK